MRRAEANALLGMRAVTDRLEQFVAEPRAKEPADHPDVGATADMRGPGRVPGLYATESAMNELADQLKIDPVKLRILNEPKLDESLGIPL